MRSVGRCDAVAPATEWLAVHSHNSARNRRVGTGACSPGAPTAAPGGACWFPLNTHSVTWVAA